MIVLAMLILAIAIVVLPTLGHFLREITAVFARVMAVAFIVVVAMILMIMLLLAMAAHGLPS